ncbi:MAG: YIP1 family protein [Candidatus Eisenbacteria bacterium]|nr:YIP1 family protein [Candidatus Eisenbacteria bacterium]
MAETPTPPPLSPALSPAGPVSPFQRFTLALGVSRRAFATPFHTPDWLIPLLIVLAVQIASGFAVHDLIVQKTMSQQEQVRAKIEEDPRMSAEQKEEAIERMESMSGGTMVTVGILAGGPLTLAIGTLAIAVLLHLIVNFGLGGQIRFAQTWLVAVLGWAPKAVESVLFTLLARLRGTVDISFGPAALIADLNSMAHRLLGVFDLFSIWVIAVQTVGLMGVAALAKNKALTAVLLLWILWWVVRIVLAVAFRNTPGM